MAIAGILAQIDSELARLTEARALLAQGGGISPTVNRKSARKSTTKSAGKRRRLSAEARARIAEAQRKRWAAQKAKTK